MFSTCSLDISFGKFAGLFRNPELLALQAG
jgi:hypothetical protein